MSTYNENLQAAVILSLQAQGLDQKTVQSKMNASMFTLYYAEGATITGREKLATALTDMTGAALVKSVAVDNTNLSNNLLASATQSNTYASKSISNTGVAAANMQVAANAVVKLASDVGGIFSMVSSADFGSEIYTQAKDARHLMDNTAYSAELASQHAMEASVKASVVSASTVVDRAKSTNAQMKNLLKVLSTDFDNASQTVSDDNATLATKSAAEKIAEGNFEDVSVDYKASTAAYKSLNRGLNLNIRVPDDDVSATGFTVKFRAIKSPFEVDKAVSYYPVQNYYLVVVKESKQFTFSLPQAEYVLLNQSRRLVPVTLPQDSKTISVAVDINNFSDDQGSYVLQDSDGDAITTGTNYVVFVMAVYVDEYKRKINVFDDFLSAPSQYFVLTNKLQPATNLLVGPSDNGNTHTLTFNTNDNPDFKIEYRCMFLLAQNPLLPTGLLSQKSVDSIKKETESLEDIAEQYDPLIEQLQAQISQLHQQQITGAVGNSDTDGQNLRTELSDAITARQAAFNQTASENPVASNIGFIFNLTIAEHIPAANYVVATAGSLNNTWQAVIGPDTTDNFGNLLLPGLQYVPVVLTASAEEEDNLPRFTNAISDFEDTPNFTAPSLNNNNNN